MKHHTTRQPIYTLAFILLCFLFVLSACSSKDSIIGVWRLEYGEFGYGFGSYEQCAIEFTEYGEYIIHEGKNYEDVYYRGSYTYKGKQLTLVIDGMFNSTMNCTLEGNKLVLVTSEGSAHFSRVDMNSSVLPFDDSVIRNKYTQEGYTILSLTWTEGSSHQRIYQTRVSQRYTYMDEEILYQDCYNYSRIGQFWYLEGSTMVSVTENWHVNGLWTYSDGFSPNTLYIHSCSSTEALVDYHISRSPSPYPDYRYSGTVTVSEWTTGSGEKYARLAFPETDGSGTYTSVYLDKDKGVLKEIGWFEKAFTHQEE